MASEVTYVGTERGWKPVATSLLESKGFRIPPPSRTVRLSEVTSPRAATPSAEPDVRTKLTGAASIKQGFRDLIIGVVDSDGTIPQKLAKIEKLLRELEQDTKTIASAKPDAKADRLAKELVQEAFAFHLKHPNAKAKQASAETARKLLGDAEYKRRLASH